MRSAVPKVMHKVGGLPMLGHVLAAATAAGATRRAVVVGPGATEVRSFLAGEKSKPVAYTQAERLGTAHAVLAARKELQSQPDEVIVLYGDTPLLTAATLKRMRGAVAKRADVVVLGFRTASPTGYGRLLVEKGRLAAIREEKDANKDERQIDFCNAGVMGFSSARAAPLLKKIRNRMPRANTTSPISSPSPTKPA